MAPQDLRSDAASGRQPALPAMPDGVLYGLPLRPPVLSWDGRRYGGARLQALDVPALHGVVAVVRREHFIGVVAVTAMLARQAVDSLHPVWQRPPRGVEAPEEGQADEPEAPAYSWRLPARAADARLAVTAWCKAGHVTIWAPCPLPHRQDVLRAELGRLLGLAVDRIEVVGIAPAQADGWHALDVLDAAADAALLSQAVQRPVRVPLQSPAVPGELALQLRDAADGTDIAASPQASAPAASPAMLAASVPWAVRPSLARLLASPAQADPSELPAAQGAMDIVVDGLRGPAMPLPGASAADFDAARVFAEESARDEEAARLGVDPLAHRLAQLPPGPGRRLAEQMAERAGWLAAPGEAERALAVARRVRGEDGLLRGRGFASAHLLETRADGAATDSWNAWVADVAVDPATGGVEVTRVVVGHDSRDLLPARGATIRSQDPRLLDAARRLIEAPARFDDWGPVAAAPDETQAAGGSLARKGAGPLAAAPIEHGQLAADGVLTLPAAAAIGNAIFDATGVRLRRVPFDSEQLRLALAQTEAAPPRRWRDRIVRGGAWLAAGAGVVAGLLAMAWPVKPAIAPIAGPDLSLYSAAAVERGRLVAAAGDCAACHTAPHGADNAGGLALETPFGTIYSTNITPDKDTGIGRWSYGAFERAMREGVHRDGRQLYPAFPYTAFAKMTDADMQALYAYLMTQPPVRSEPPRTELAFPYKLRPALAGWNLLFHDAGVYQPDPERSPAWNRGAYLVEGMGHCGACHTPRNALGAEKTGPGRYLSGGVAEGWEAPALDRLAEGKTPWTADDLFQYLRTGYSARHGVAAGPMAPVVHGLAQLPESDVHAITTYLLDLPGGSTPRSGEAPVPTPVPTPAPASAPSALPAGAGSKAASAQLFPAHVNGERLYQNACAACHEAGGGPTLFGVKPLLATNTSVQSDTPGNLAQVILNGIQAPANDELGYMPGFKDSFDDSQVADLLAYLRARFAPGKPAWTDSREVIARVRAQSEAHADARADEASSPLRPRQFQ